MQIPASRTVRAESYAIQSSAGAIQALQVCGLNIPISIYPQLPELQPSRASTLLDLNRQHRLPVLDHTLISLSAPAVAKKPEA